MPTFRILSAEELESFQPPVTGERARIRAEYREYIQTINPGEGGELQLSADEKKVTIKNRLKRAAAEMNMMIEFKRSSSETVRFCIPKENEES